MDNEYELLIYSEHEEEGNIYGVDPEEIRLSYIERKRDIEDNG